MAPKQVSVGVQVELQAKASSMKKLYEDVSNLMANIDPGSALAKSMSKALGKLRDQVSDFESISGKSFISSSDLTSALNLYKRFYRDINRMNESVQGAGFNSFIHEDSVIQALQKIQDELNNVKSAAEQIKSINIGDAFKLSNKDQKNIKDLQQKFSLKADDDTSIEDARTAAMDNLIAKTEEYNKALARQEELAKSQQKIAIQMSQYSNLRKTHLDTKEQRKDFSLGKMYDVIGDMKGNWVTDLYESSFTDLVNSFFQTTKNGQIKFADFGRDRVEALANLLGIDLSKISQDAATIQQEVLRALSNTSQSKFKSVVSSSRAIVGNMTGYQQAKTAFNTLGISDKDYVALQNQYSSQKTELNNLASNISALESLRNDAEILQQQINDLYDAVFGNLQKEELDKRRDLRKQQKDIQVLSTQPTKQAMPNIVAAAGQDVSGLGENVERHKAEVRAEQEAENFKANLQASVRHWMGAQQAITLIKQGIRQAYQDIQGLDKAMTNIAVVTDFNVSDLWGKINEYMSIAQQYGVTTQGVYEVSQLYFQQGLGEADTMAATTETLKMARIAGMDYKDAADGMTVAIRGFNMEMSEASRVTDVYSKVAAITASNTQELVTAMSKTASSAAAVNSSFENTTAMLAVMIEATRESPQNLGSALKSIISRYGEMTKGLSEDSEGEEIDYNRVDTALKTVGISLKDAQGQFRDFDTVIEELSAKWATLDSVTQRYIATIFAGNRQQSRFLALVSNYDRYMEVSEAAANSEDAGLLQYSKTLDSLETKLNNIKTSFQQFYMSLINGDNVKGILDFINDLIRGLNKLSKFTSILNFGSIVIGVKTIGNLLINGFTSGMSQIQTNWRVTMQQLVEIARKGGIDSANAFNSGAQGMGKGGAGKQGSFSTGSKALLNGGLILGGALSLYGTSLAQKNQTAGAIVSGIGNMATYGVQGGLMGFSAGGPYGAAIGAAIGALGGLVSMISSIPTAVEKAQQEFEQAQEKAQESNIRRAETKQKIEDLSSGIEQLKELSETQYDSAEAQKEWIDANNSLFERFPELSVTFDEAGNAIVDLSSAEQALTAARIAAAAAARDSAKDAYEQAKKERDKKQLDLDAYMSQTVSEGNWASGKQYLYINQQEANALEAADKRRFEREGRSYWSMPKDDLSYVGYNPGVTATLASSQYAALINSGINLMDEDMASWVIDHADSSGSEILTDVRNKLIKGELKFKEGVDASSFIAKLTSNQYSTITDFLGDYNKLVAELKASDEKIENAASNLTSTDVSNLLNSETYVEEEWRNLENSSQVIQQEIKRIQGNQSYESFEAQIPGYVESLAQAQKALYNELFSQGQIEEFNQSIQSLEAGKITKADFDSQLLANLGVSSFDQLSPEIKTAIEAYRNSYFESINDSIANTAMSLSLESRNINWGVFAEKDSETGEIINVAGGFLENLPKMYHDEVIKIANSLEDKIDSGFMPDEIGQEIADNYLAIITQIQSIQDPEKQAQALDAFLKGDIFTTSGLYELGQKFQDLGVQIDVSKIPVYAENLVTQYGVLQDKLISNLESATKALQRASEGTSLEEASSIAKKVGKDVTELFDFQDGKYFAKNANALKEIYKTYNKDLTENLDNALADQLNILTNQQYDFELDQDGQIIQESIRPNQEYLDLMEQYGDLAESWFQELEDPTTEGLTADSSLTEKVKAYLTDYSEDVAATIEEEATWQFEQAEKALLINNRTHELESTGVGKDLREAYSLLSSKGLSGYSANEIAQLETYLGVGANGLRARETGIGTGEYKITRGMLESLNLPVWVQDSINARIEEQVQSTKSGLEDLMGSVASGEELTDTQIKSLLGQEFEGISDTIARGYQAAMQVALETGNFGHLENILKTVYKSKGAENANKLAKESIVRFQDQVRESQEEIIDLSISALEGDISAEDALKLGTQGIDVDGLINRTQEAINTLVQSIVDNTDISFSDKKSKLESVYNAGLESILGYETSIADSLISREGMPRSDASSMMAELTALGVETKGRFEESADGTKFYLNNVTDIMRDLTRTIEDESTNPQQRAAAESLLKQVRYAQEWQPYELADSLGSTIEEMVNATEVSTIEMRDFYKELTGRDISVDDAQRLARELNELDPVARIERLVAIARQSGIEVEGIEERLAEVAANVLDTIIEAISNGMSAIGKGLSGSLSFSSLNELMQKYNLQVQDSFGTASGATLGEQDRRSLIAAMYKEAKASGLQVDFGDQLWETFRDSDNNPFVGYNAIDEELSQARNRVRELQSDYEAALRNQRATDIWLQEAHERAETYATPDVLNEAAQAEAMAEQANAMAESTARAAEEARAYAEALEQAHAAAMFDENAYEFTFMEQDATSGLTKNTDNFINQIDAVKAAFQSFKNDEAISYQDFYNMMDFMKNTGQWESFSENISNAGIQYEDFVNSVVANTDEWGKVDIGGVAAQMGISVDAAMTAMSDSMKSGLIEVAKQQVDYLTGLESMLKAMAALESIGDIGLGLNITIEGETQTAEEWINSWESLDEDTRKQFIIELKTNLNDNIFDNNGITQDMRGAFDELFGDGFGDTLNSSIFNEQGDIISTEIAGQYMQLAASISKASQDRSGETAQGMAHVMQNAYGAYMSSLNNTLNEDGVWVDAQEQIVQLQQEQQLELLRILNDAAKNATPMDIAGFSESYLQALNAGDTQVNISEGRTIELNWDGTTTITDANGNPLTPETVRALDAEAIAQMEADLNQNRADTDHYYDLIVDAQGHLTYNIIPVGDVNAVLENTPDMLTINEEEIDVIVNANTQSITFADSHGRTLTGEALQQAMDAYTSQMNLGDRGVELNVDENGIITLVPTITPAPSNTEILAQIAGDIQEIKDSLLEGFDITLNGDQATSALGAIQSAYDGLRAHFEANPIIATVTQVGGISLPNTPTGSPTTQTSTGAGSFAGTMNGLAFADGSLGRLHSGAVLANKALVGELGPELAVYDGQYHMLGANGAEFVDLPSDAIIFNHLQTQGILRGQMNIRGTAMAEGNVSGPAFAGGGIGAALAAVSRAKSVWQGLLHSLSAADLMEGGGGGGGGGGDESLKAHIADLQEWYNLSRQIADIEGQINVLLAKRKNITDGHEYLKNLRETQRLLDDQVNTQQDLLRFQQLQLQRQASHINTHDIWSQFLEVDENGLLQYKEGNETNGGKGALEILQQMNEMSGEEQTAFLAKLGYSYTDNDGNVLEGSELVAKFYEELQKQIDDYDALRDTVQEAEGALADLEAEIAEIEKEIRDNEIDLSKEIYDIIVDAWEENIKNLKEQNDLIKEANEAYANGIQEAIDAERQMYDQNTAISDREQLQRQLALMRRSGGSASEIADLEQRLDDMLKEEYFSNQEKQLETIQKANERQVELMDQQVKLQEEALEYEKENGVIWTKVYEVMQGTDAEILDFMQGNKIDFFEQSALQQEDMLTEWAKKIGIYTEERQRQNYAAEAAKTFSSAWKTEQGKGLKEGFDKADTEQQEKWKREYNDTYAAKRLEGKTHEEALALAQKELYEHIQNWLKAEEDKKQQNSSSNSNNNSSNSNTEQHGTRTVWQAYGKKNDQGQRKWGPRNTNSREGARQGFKSQYGFWPEGVDERIEEYAKGGIIDKTGLAWVDGSKSNPKHILSAEQNHILEEGLAMNAGRSDRLREMFSNFAENLGASVRASISNITNRTSSSAITIQPGAVQLNIEQLNDKYDVDELFNDVADRLYSIASKASGRGVSRR